MQPRICHTKEEWAAIDQANREKRAEFCCFPAQFPR